MRKNCFWKTENLLLESEKTAFGTPQEAQQRLSVALAFAQSLAKSEYHKAITTQDGKKSSGKLSNLVKVRIGALEALEKAERERDAAAAAARPAGLLGLGGRFL